MRNLLIILGIIFVLQLGTLAVGVNSDDGPKPTEDELAEQEFPLMGAIDTVMRPFRPKLDFGNRSDLLILGGQTTSLEFTNGDEETRKATFTFDKDSNGKGIRIRYQCDKPDLPQNRDNCLQVTCICRSGAIIDPADFKSCGKLKLDGNKCPKNGNIASIIVDITDGQIEFTGLGEDSDGGGRVKLR